MNRCAKPATRSDIITSEDDGYAIVTIQRLRYGGVPQRFLQVPGVGVAVEWQGGASIAEVVESGDSML
jgi:hypothetical protein